MDRNFPRLNRYDKSTGQFQLYTANDNKPDGLTHSSIWCIVKDEQGTLWLGTYFGGVNYFNPNMKSIPAIKWETRRKKD